MSANTLENVHILVVQVTNHSAGLSEKASRHSYREHGYASEVCVNYSVNRVIWRDIKAYIPENVHVSIHVWCM
jgi:hypothetical protein